MTNFNYHFERTWNRIPTMVRPFPKHAFLYYLRALNCDIVVMIQSMGAVTLPTTYDVAIRIENSLIQARKIAHRPPMPIFPNIQPLMPLQVPPIAMLPTVPILEFQKISHSNAIIANAELQEFKGT